MNPSDSPFDTPNTFPDPLTYQSEIPPTGSRISRIASSLLALLGSLTLLEATCLTGFLLAIQSAFGGESSPKGPYGLDAMSARDCLLLTILFLAPAIMGAAEILCAFKIRNRSTPAAIAALLLVSA